MTTIIRKSIDIICSSFLSSTNPKLLCHNYARSLSTTVTMKENQKLDKELYKADAHKVSDIEDFLKVTQTSKDNETYVEAVPCPTGREGKVLENKSDACALCRLNLRGLNYSDVMILSQFVKRDGSLATFHESKLCTKQYMKVKRLIRQARRCNLMKRPADYLVPGPWHDLNTYLESDRQRDQPMKVIKKKYWKL